MKRIGLDVDGVLCNFPQGAIERAKAMGFGEHFPDCCHDVEHWSISPHFSAVMKDAWKSPEFWLKLKPLPYSIPLDFTPDCYITSRPIESWVTEQWLDIWRFPKAPVITVESHTDKLVHIIERKLDLFVDDYHETVEMLIENGINAVLFAAPFHKGHMVEHLPTIQKLSEIKNYEQELPANR